MKTAKVALYHYVKHGFDSVHQVCDSSENDKDRVRVSEIVEVEFTERNQGEVIAARVNAIDNFVESLRDQMQIALEQKAQLLALTHE